MQNYLKFSTFSSKKFSVSYSHIKSAMFVPGNQEKMLKKSYTINSHIVVPDLEDSVPPGEKENARKIITQHFESISQANSKRFLFPRVNSIGSGLLEKDLDGIFNESTAKFISGFVVPKVNSKEEFEYVSDYIEKKEKKIGLEINKTKLIIWIESTLGFVNMKEIYKTDGKSKRIIAAAFGAEDFSHDFGIERTENLKEIEVYRSLFAVTSHAYNIIPMDTPNVNFKNPENLIEEINYVKKLGFKAKFAIHPSQVEIINKYFNPSDSEIKEAQVINSEFEKAMQQGRGSIDVNGKMVDIPVYKRALKTLDRAGILSTDNSNSKSN